MGQILFAGGGGGTVNSDDLTATAAHVLKGKTYMGNDTDDDAGTGTMPNIDAIDDGVSLTISGDKLYCRMHNGAHIQNASPGYPEVSYPLSTVRSAINYTDASKVLNNTTICGMTGTMPNRGKYQYSTSFGSGNDGSSDYAAFNNIPYGYYENGNDGWSPEIRIRRDFFKTSCINYFGIGSVSNFSVAQYSSQTLLFTWANPGSGKMWSGVRIVGKQGGWPSDPEDGTVKYDSASGWLTTGSLSVGTWYFRAWNYVTTSSERWYGGYSQASIYNNNVYGKETFTYGQSWTVPAAVRSIQYFIVGAGGGSYINSSNKKSRYSNGGGGGRTATGYANVTPGQTLEIVIGQGVYGSNGGDSCIVGIATGYGGSVGNCDGGSGSGGSGGGAGHYSSAGNGGSNGANGNSTSGRDAGYGQGSSTACPWDGALYSGGGGGGSAYNSGGGAGGSDGGGAGAKSGANGTDGTGGGAGGCGRDSSDGSADSSQGGSGIVRIRW